MDRTTTDPAQPDPADPADPVDAIAAQWRRERPDLTPQTEAMAAFGRIYRIARAMGERAEQAYAPYGIGRGEFDVLATLRRAGDPYTLSPRELTATLMLTTGGMTGRLDKLERAGLLTRSPDPNDRRGLKVTLTPAGLDTVDGAAAAGMTVQQHVMASLGERDAEQLNRLLRTLMAAAEG
ncbi:MarR family transcriptional regulator [Kitasatospora sp. NPDC048540]|uniref:MarR family winged helix-turn-helix transcriptional regulator n=1 Tax=Kitasatospora sp. NPDC048540 TaxID=3155634 RepID=UPI0033DE72AE